MTHEQADELLTALESRFGGDVEAEEVSPGRYRIIIETPTFTNMPHLTRQDRLWEVVDEVLPRENTLDITLIIAFAPGERELTPY